MMEKTNENTLDDLEYILYQFIDKYPFMNVIYKWSWEMDSYIASFNFDEKKTPEPEMFKDLERIFNYFEKDQRFMFTVNEQLFEVPGPYKTVNIRIVQYEKFQGYRKRKWTGVLDI